MTMRSRSTRAAAPRVGPPGVVEVDVVGDLAERRRHAISEAVAEACSAHTPSDPDSGVPAIAMRTYGPGCLALALAGTFDRAGIERLRTLAPTVDGLVRVELVVDLSRLTSCRPALARALAQLRIRCLTAGAHVELRSPPAALAVELGHAPAAAFTVLDGPVARHHRR